tara:strand:- start:2861 stop:3142 length:282 start_codon:yes stop_codon:yes gene_type:complete
MKIYLKKSNCFLFFGAVFMLIHLSVAGYSCSSATNCHVFCNNFSPNALRTLEGSDWIAVPWDTGACYFHNKRTREDQGELPIRKHLKINKIRI